MGFFSLLYENMSSSWFHCPTHLSVFLPLKLQDQYKETQGYELETET